jgi:hypothetical protein
MSTRIAVLITALVSAALSAVGTYLVMARSIACRPVAAYSVSPGQAEEFRTVDVVWNFDFSWFWNIVNLILGLPGRLLAWLGLIRIPSLALPNLTWPWERDYSWFPLGLLDVHLPPLMTWLAALAALIILVTVVTAEWVNRWRHNRFGLFIRHLGRRWPFRCLPYWVKNILWAPKDFVVETPEPDTFARIRRHDSTVDLPDTYGAAPRHDDRPFDRGETARNAPAVPLAATGGSWVTDVPAAPTSYGASRGGSSYTSYGSDTHLCRCTNCGHRHTPLR